MGCDELQVITSDSFECSLYVIFNRKEELSESCLISSELANSYAVNPHEKHITRPQCFKIPIQWLVLYTVFTM